MTTRLIQNTTQQIKTRTGLQSTPPVS